MVYKFKKVFLQLLLKNPKWIIALQQCQKSWTASIISFYKRAPECTVQIGYKRHESEWRKMKIWKLFGTRFLAQNNERGILDNKMLFAKCEVVSSLVMVLLHCFKKPFHLVNCRIARAVVRCLYFPLWLRRHLQRKDAQLS